jgi:hypothetical protein
LKSLFFFGLAIATSAEEKAGIAAEFDLMEVSSLGRVELARRELAVDVGSEFEVKMTS